MPQSLHSNFAHIVFSTKNREPMIGGDVAGRIHSYLAGIVRDQGAVLISINGMPDQFMLIKSSKNTLNFIGMEVPQAGSIATASSRAFQMAGRYGWFSVSPKDTDQVVAYIQNQAEHHKNSRGIPEFLKL